jgi:hypothetical protein
VAGVTMIVEDLGAARRAIGLSAGVVREGRGAWLRAA